MAQFMATSKAADAPDIEAAVYDGTFLRTESKTMTGGKFQKNPEGDPKLEWYFQLLDDDGDVLYSNGDPVEVSKLTGVGFNVTSKTVPAEVNVLKALLSKAEFDAFVEGEGTPDSEAAAPAGLVGRKVQLEVYINDKGWPGVGYVIAARKPVKSSK